MRLFDVLSPSEVLSARMVEVSYIYLVEGTHAAQDYTNKYITNFEAIGVDPSLSLSGFKLDHDLLTEHQAVFVRPRAQAHSDSHI